MDYLDFKRIPCNQEGFHRWAERARAAEAERAALQAEVAELKDTVAAASYETIQMVEALEEIRDNKAGLHEMPGSDGHLTPCWACMDKRDIARAALARPSPTTSTPDSDDGLFERPKPSPIKYTGKIVSVSKRPPMVIEADDWEIQRAEQWSAMERVCEAARLYRRLSRAGNFADIAEAEEWLDKALDALAAIQRANQ